MVIVVVVVVMVVVIKSGRCVVDVGVIVLMVFVDGGVGEGGYVCVSVVDQGVKNEEGVAEVQGFSDVCMLDAVCPCTIACIDCHM